MQVSLSRHFMLARSKSQTYIIPLHNIRNIIVNDIQKSMTIKYLGDTMETKLYDENIKTVFYDTLKDMRATDARITECNIERIEDGEIQF